MSALMALALLLQQKDPLVEGWKQLRDAWKAASEAKADEDYVADRFLAAAAKVWTALEATGLNAKDLAPDRAALRRAMKARLVPAVASKIPAPKSEDEKREHQELRAILRALEELEEGKGGRVNARERFVEALATIARQAPLVAAGKEPYAEVVASLETLVVVDRDAPMWLKRRVATLVIALETGGAFPPAAAPTPELKARIARLIEQLGDADIARRDRAVEELVEIGEAAVPQLQEAAQSTDPEVCSRARRILGLKD